MTTSVLEGIQHDLLAQAVARALTLANEVAAENGMNPAESRVAITEESSDAGLCWQIYYAPREYLNMRGGIFSYTLIGMEHPFCVFYMGNK
jgi:hypothetical protein